MKGKKQEESVTLEDGDRYFTIPRAAEYCGGISEARIRLGLARGEFRRFKAGPSSHARTLIAESDLRKFIRQVA